MSRPRVVHRCNECGSTFAKWSGRCSQCQAWNSLVEELEARPRGSASGPATTLATMFDFPGVAPAEPMTLAASLALGEGLAVPTGIDELDRALGGGLVPGSVTLVGGEPGIGKSTLLLQAAAAMACSGRRPLVVSGEESVEQLARRARRLGNGAEAVSVLATGSLSELFAAAESYRPDLLVVDSIQTVADPELNGSAGTVVQVRECAAQLVRYAKARGVTTVLLGHVTKDGTLAGPRLLEHLVDTVCSFEGDRHHGLRTVSVVKHRFGAAGELGVFTMTSEGLVGVPDPSGLFLADRSPGVPGSVVVPILEGRRPLLVEVQALVATTTNVASPRRAVQGLAGSRLAMLLAVLEQRVGIRLAADDVFASVVGGIKIAEPAGDLGLALALVSAAFASPLGEGLVACGEVGLGGELRQVVHADRRLAEAARLGFSRAVVPATSPSPPPGMTLIRASTLAEAVSALGLSRQEAPAPPPPSPPRGGARPAISLERSPPSRSADRSAAGGTAKSGSEPLR